MNVGESFTLKDTFSCLPEVIRKVCHTPGENVPSSLVVIVKPGAKCHSFPARTNQGRCQSAWDIGAEVVEWFLSHTAAFAGSLRILYHPGLVMLSKGPCPLTISSWK